MSEIKLRIEMMFESIGYFVCNHRKKILLIMLLIILGVVSQMKKLTVDTSFEGMLHKYDPKRLEYNAFRDQFGQDRVILITVQTPEIFQADSLLKIKKFHEEMEDSVPYLKEVRSLINARRTRGEGDTLIVEDLFEGWPETPLNLDEIKTFALKNPIYINDYISEDGRVAAFIVEPLAFVDDEGSVDATDDFSDDTSDGFGDEENAEPTIEDERPGQHNFLSKEHNRDIVQRVFAIADTYESDDFRISIAGGPVIEEVYDTHTKKNMRMFTFIMMGVVILALGLLFRRVSGAIYPLIIVYSSLMSTFGIMGFFGVSISVFSIVLPSFLMAVGIADAVHILAIFYREFQNGRSKFEAIAFSMKHSGLAIVMTSLTTAAGLLSFSMSELSSIGHLGIFASVGVMLALLYTVVMLPAFLAITPLKRKQIKKDSKSSQLMDTFLTAIADFSVNNSWKIIIVCMVLFVVSIGFMFQLHFSHYHKHIFPETMRIRQDEDFINKQLRGIASVEVVLDTKKENGLYNPDILKGIDSLSEEILKIEDGELFVDKARTMNDILKETNQALHGNDPEYYTIPDDRELIAQELILFENSGSDDLERVVDSQFSKTRISYKIPTVEVLQTEAVSNTIHQRFLKKFKNMAEITVTGMSPMMGTTVSAAIRSMSKSYVVAFFVISIMMILLVGDIKLGALSMVPNMFPICFVMGIMGAFGVFFDLNALMIGSIAIGLVVDDTMHFIYNFRRYYEEYGDINRAVKETFLSTGRALLITSLVLAANFFVLMFATFTSTYKFGFYTGFVVIMALISDFILAPALIVVFVPYMNLRSDSQAEPELKLAEEQA